MSRRWSRSSGAEMDFLLPVYLWIKALHIVSVIAWMAGLFYLPRLYVYHAERGRPGSELSETLKVMEEKLCRVIMTPAMLASWTFGLLLVGTPGVVEWGAGWVWCKVAGVVGLTLLHLHLKTIGGRFAADERPASGRYFRVLNEVPTVLLLIIVFMVVIKPF